MGTVITVWNWYRSYFAAGGYGVMFVIALMWLWHRSGKARTYRADERTQKTDGALSDADGQKEAALPEPERRHRFLWPVVILLALIFCPLSAWAIMKAIGSDVYWRVFWVLPVIPVLAWALTELAGSVSRGWRRLLAAAGCAAVLALNGTWVFGGTFFAPRENNYKLPTRIIETADAIEAHAQEHGEKRRVVAQMDISVLIRLYRPSFTTYYGRQMLQKPWTQTALYDEVNAESPDPEELVRLSEKYHYRYIVLKQDQDNREAMLSQDLEVIMDQDGYVVYYDPYFARKKQE